MIITTHELFYGASQAFRDYLNTKNSKKILFISHPILTHNPHSYTQKFLRGQFLSQRNKQRPIQGSVVGYLLDMTYTITWVLSDRATYDVFVGVNALNCLVGLILRKFGIVKHVIFYSIDFTPTRFSQRLMNIIYHWIESVCIKHVDERWNVSPRIGQGRETLLHISENEYPQKIVPIGVWERDITQEAGQFNRYALVFLGHLLQKQGVQMILQSLPAIKEKIPEISLHIIGGGEYEHTLKKITTNMRLSKYVKFYGWMSDQVTIRRIMSQCALAMATYDPSGENESNFSYYADPTKIKSYLSCGLPVIMTNISYNAQKLSKRKCAVLVDYSVESVAGTIIELLKNTSRLKLYRKNAIDEAKQFTWEKIFARATGL